MMRTYLVLWIALMLAGCARSPSLAVLGAYFPDWLFCITGAVIGVAVARIAVAKSGDPLRFGPPALFYPALAAFFSLAGWLIFFQH
jgi:hypothetical protein